MHKRNGSLIFSPTDLSLFSGSPFAVWMNRFALEFPKEVPEKNTPNARLTALIDRGFLHEQRVEQRFIESELNVVRIEGEDNAIKTHLSKEAMQNGADVIVQARLEQGQFAGFPDFLVKIDIPSQLGDYSYEIWDAKLSQTPKPHFIIQLCCYVEMLKDMQGTQAPTITLALGNDKNERLHVNNFEAYYQNLKSNFLHQQNMFDANKPPDLIDSFHYGDWSNYANQLIIEKDHLLQVARITKEQIQEFNSVGIHTMQQLIDADVDGIKNINHALTQRLQAQAVMQKENIDRKTPQFKLLTSENEKKILGLAFLPSPTASDVYFNVKSAANSIYSLRYLWGAMFQESNSKWQFKEWWGHSSEEYRAFSQFVIWMHRRWQQDLNMHVYYYGANQLDTLNYLVDKYGICETEIEQMIDYNVFIDLAKIINDSMLVSTPTYSLGNITSIYNPSYATDALDLDDNCAMQYSLWQVLCNDDEPNDNRLIKEQILKDISQHTMNTCESLISLIQWLHKQSKEQNIQPIDVAKKHNAYVHSISEKAIVLRNELLKNADEERNTDAQKSRLTENLAWALEFHKRESKPVFKKLSARLDMNDIDLINDAGCLAQCQYIRSYLIPADDDSFEIPIYEYQFDAQQDFKESYTNFYALDTSSKNKALSIKATLDKEHSDIASGIIALRTSATLPKTISLIPDEYISPHPIPENIFRVVENYSKNKLGKQNAIINFLMRNKPKIVGADDQAIALSDENGEQLQQLIHTVSRLDNSYLAIQGPPGTGKSYTATRIIAELLKSGKRIGISSNSHKAINHLLFTTAKYCAQNNIDAFFGCTQFEDRMKQYDISHLRNNEVAQNITGPCVIGCTAWGFSRSDMKNQLDYLFIDEAGQVTVANLIGMSLAAQNLVLVGDHMQLSQPKRANHPADIGLSVLDYLLADTLTIKNDMAVFLNTTYRMHSKINQFISRHIYQDKLISHTNNDKRAIQVPNDYSGILNKEAGIIFVPVKHTNNTQSSNEEAQIIHELATSLIGRHFVTDNHHTNKTIDWEDMLFVTPYNQQVHILQKHLGEQAKIGTVDRFQGQEAPIVFLSLCASNTDYLSRGISFLLDRNRINVAISRAQVMAIIVANPNLGSSRAYTVDQMRLINLFNHIIAC